MDGMVKKENTHFFYENPLWFSSIKYILQLQFLTPHCFYFCFDTFWFPFFPNTNFHPMHPICIDDGIYAINSFDA